MKTVKQFVVQSNLPGKLIRATIRQVGGWEEFKARAEDVTNHGAAGGFSGFIYYTDTVAFTKRNKQAIREDLEQLAEDLGEDFAKILCGFNCLKNTAHFDILEGFYTPSSDYRTEVYNALAWYALEEVCRSYCDILEQSE